MPNPEAVAIEEIRGVRNDCLGLLAKMQGLCPADANGHYPETFRLIATPMLYAVWERCFTLCHSIALRMVRDVRKKTDALSTPQRALWLQRQGFYQSFLALIAAAPNEEVARRAKRGTVTALCNFLAELEVWGKQDIDTSIDTDDLVMRFSNVNPAVVALNAGLLGIEKDQAFKAIEFGRLHELVQRRNDIGHGGMVTPPGNKEFTELWAYTENLIKDYCKAFENWMRPPAATAVGVPEAG